MTLVKAHHVEISLVTHARAPLDLYFGSADSSAAHLNGVSTAGQLLEQMEENIAKLQKEVGDDLHICTRCFWTEVSAWAMAKAMVEGASLNTPALVLDRAQALFNEGRGEAKT